MGRRGPAPKPNVIQIAKGDPGKRAKRQAKVEPVVPECEYQPPPELDGPALEEWSRVVALLNEMAARGQRLMTGLDVAGLTMYCKAWAEYWEAEEHLKDGKILVTDKGYKYASPWLGIRNTAADQIKKFAAEFGFTPSARSRLQILPEKKTSPQKEHVKNIIGF